MDATKKTVHALIGKFVSLFNWAGKLGEKLDCTRKKKHFTSLSENPALLSLYSTVPLTREPFVFWMLIFAAIKASKRPANQSAQTQRKKNPFAPFESCAYIRNGGVALKMDENPQPHSWADISAKGTAFQTTGQFDEIL